MNATLYYAHDPMCSWCWGFRRTWEALQDRLPPSVDVVRLLGGLAPDSDAPMPVAMQQMLQQTWQRIAEQIPGTEFNLDFWRRCAPRRSTYPACRAVIAAAKQGQAYDRLMTLAIQQAYYLNAQNPSDDRILIALANELGLDIARFEQALNDDATQAQLLEEIVRCQQLGAQGFPSSILEQGQQRWLLPMDYLSPESTLERISQLLELS